MSRLLEMLDPTARETAVDAITTAIATSFLQDKTVQTQRETRHRFELCLNLVLIMRNDLKWSWPRIKDNLPSALRCKLDDGDWTPPAQNAWMVDEKTGLTLPASVRS